MSQGFQRFQDSTCYEYEQNIVDQTDRRGFKILWVMNIMSKRLLIQLTIEGHWGFNAGLSRLLLKLAQPWNIVFNILFNLGILYLTFCSSWFDFNPGNLGGTIFNLQFRFLTFQKCFKQVITGWFFPKGSSRFSVPKWKTGWCQQGKLFQEIFSMKKRLPVNWAVFFILVLKMWRNSKKIILYIFQEMFWTIWYQGCQTSGRWQRLRGSLHGREAWGKLFFRNFSFVFINQVEPRALKSIKVSVENTLGTMWD